MSFTARYAGIWRGFGDADTIRHKNEVLDGWCREAGRDPSEIERSTGIDSKNIEGADALIEAGATQLTIGFGGPDYDLAVVDEWVAWRDARNS